jgi:hypothetical protein
MMMMMMMMMIVYEVNIFIIIIILLNMNFYYCTCAIHSLLYNIHYIILEKKRTEREEKKNELKKQKWGSELH